MRCLGYREGTGCKKNSRHPYAFNWTEWQLCYECALILHAVHYKDMPKKGTGGTYIKEPDVNSMITQ